MCAIGWKTQQGQAMNLEEQVFADIVASFDEVLALRPTKLIVPAWIHDRILRAVFYKSPMRRVSGVRRRKLALYWREK